MIDRIKYVSFIVVLFFRDIQDELLMKIDDLEMFLKEKDKIIHDKENVIKNQRETLAIIHDQNVDIDLYNGLKEEFESLQKKYDNIRQKYEFIQSENQSIQRQVDDLYTSINEKDDEIKKLEKYKNDFKLLKEKNSTLSEELLQSDRIINNQREKMSDYEEMVKTLETQISQLKEKYSINIKRNISFNYSFDHSISDLNNVSMQEMVGETVADIKINSLEEDIRNLVVEKKDLEHKLSTVQNEKTLAMKSQKEAEETINSLNIEMNRLKNQCDEKNQQLLQQKTRIQCWKQSVDEELNKVKSSFVAMKDNHENFTKKFENEIYNNCSQIINVFNEQLKTISLLSHFKHTLEIRLEEICADNTKIQQENQTSKLMIEKLENNHTVQMEQTEKLQSEYDEAKKEIKRLLVIIDDNREKINATNNDENYREKSAKLTEELEAMKIETKKIEMKRKNLHNAYLIEQQSFMAERKTKDRLLKENLDLEREIGKLKKTIAQLESNVTDKQQQQQHNHQLINQETPQINLPRQKSKTFVIPSSPSNVNQKHNNKLPEVKGIKFEMADEEGEFMDPNKIEMHHRSQPAQPPLATPFPQERINQLRHRNKLLRPHLRTSYPVEFQNVKLDEKIIQGATPAAVAALRCHQKSTRERITSTSENNIPIKRSKL